MNKIKFKNLLEFFCPTLVLSYFFIHNILFVIIGILLSMYLINTSIVEKLLGYFNRNPYIEDLTVNQKNNDVSIESKSIDINVVNQDTNLKLVDIIEESGFIPSIDKSKDINAA